MGQGLTGYFSALKNPTLAVNSVRVALVVGSILFVINHGGAAMENRMSRARWISALLTYCVPYGVSIHGQYVAGRR